MNSKCGVQSKRKCESHESCVCIVGFPACGCQKKSEVYETECRHAGALYKGALYNTTLLLSVNVIAHGVFCGAKYSNTHSRHSLIEQQIK